MGDGQVQQPAAIHQRLHDPRVMIEEYLYYAKLQREQERQGLGPGERTALQLAGLRNPAAPNVSEKTSSDGNGVVDDEKRNISTETPVHHGQNTVTMDSNHLIAPAEWENASRAARNATWGAV